MILRSHCCIRHEDCSPGLCETEQTNVKEHQGILSHHEIPTNKPRPGRRRQSSVSQRYTGVQLRPKISFSISRLLLISICLVLLVFCDSVAASSSGSRTLTERGELRRLARKGELLVDRSEPPSPRMRLIQRDESSSGLPSAILPTSTGGRSSSSTPSGTASSTGTATSALATESSTATQYPLPSPFDSSLGNNFTASSCPTFFQKFLSNGTFTSCLPLSLLLQTSNSFFSAERSLVRLTQTLDATCNVDFNKCNAVMSDLAGQLTNTANCGADFQAQNPNVMQAYDGFLAYPVLYNAGCQKDSGGNYCFANAATNTSSVTDSYPYYLPLGVALPGGARPTCNSCLQSTMSTFSSSASNKTQPVSQVYNDAAAQINVACGPSYVTANVMVTSGTSPRQAPSGPLSLLLVLAVMFWSWL